MENASKALLMAGGMILSILLITLLVYAWSLFSKYQSSNDELADIEDVAKFNQQFTNYDRDDVEGYELISLINKVVDYNHRKSSTGTNDIKNKPITIEILLKGNGKVFTKDKDNNLLLFKSDSYTQSGSNNILTGIIKEAQTIEDKYGGVTFASKLAKNYDSIFLSPTQVQQEIDNSNNTLDDRAVWERAKNKYNSIVLKNKVSSANELRPNGSRSIEVLKYYEYMQFKRGVFKCTDLDYDKESGKVSKIKFEFDGEIH